MEELLKRGRPSGRALRKMPFLIPLVLQVCLGYSPIEAGLMMLPITFAGMLSKRVATRVIERYGYRRVLVANTLCNSLATSTIFSYYAGITVI